jgi:hypothetical protein
MDETRKNVFLFRRQSSGGSMNRKDRKMGLAFRASIA